MERLACSHGLHCGNDGFGNEWHESDDCPLNPLNYKEPEPAPPTYWQERVGPSWMGTSRGGWIALLVIVGLPIAIYLLSHLSALPDECLDMRWAC